MAIESVMHENRVFNPPKTLSENAYVKNLEEYQQLCDAAEADYEGYWGNLAKNLIDWKKPFTKILNEDDAPFYKWFDDGELNVSYNCIDRHLPNKKDKVAIIFESDDGQTTEVTYQELYEKVCQFANGLKTLNLNLGDRVIIYLPMGIEAVVAMQACARIGLTHSVVFGGFSAKSIQERVIDAGAKLIITADYQNRGGKELPLKTAVDDAILLGGCDSVEKVIVLNRTGKEAALKENEIDWHALCKNQKEECEPVWVNAEHPLFLLYTSGSTGKPKGVVHSTAGYMVYTYYSFLNVFQYNPTDIYWCTADIGWITGHSYIIYGPLLAGATSVMFEGVPTYPHPGRFWEIIDKFKINQFYTAPTAIRALQAYGLDPITPYSLASLTVIGSVGEPINEEAWHWYHTNIGKGKCPLVDTWWQTETGGIMISPLAGITPNKPAHASLPLPGIQPVIVDAEGNELKGNNVEGNLCIAFPWPSIIRTTYGDHKRCKETYFSTYPGMYFTGDGAKRDHDGYFRILGRVDDVINVSGHRMGTAEVENAINEHPKVIESAVVGYPHDIKGQGIYAFVICESSDDIAKLSEEIKDTVRKIIGPIAKPDVVQIVPGLPKTRSGKIMRRILRKVASQDLSNMGDTSTLLNPEVVEEIIKGAQKN